MTGMERDGIKFELYHCESADVSALTIANRQVEEIGRR